MSFLALSLAACGPVYLHDPAGETAAKAAAEDFEAALERGRVGSLVAGYKAQRPVVVEALRTIELDERRTLIVGLAAEPWDEVIGATEDELETITVELGSLPAEQAAIERELQAALLQQPGVIQRATSLIDAMNKAAAAEARYAATQRILSAGLTTLVSDGQTDAEPEAALKEVIEEKVRARSFELKDGILVEKRCATGASSAAGDPCEITVSEALDLNAEQIGALTTLPRDVASLAQLVRSLTSLRDFNGLQITDPGIAVTILGLGYDVARAEELRLASLIEGARRKQALYANGSYRVSGWSAQG
jgi:hypothetical protein